MGPREAGFALQPETVYGNEKSRRMGEEPYKRYGDDQGVIGSASFQPPRSWRLLFARLVIAARNGYLGSGGGAGAEQPDCLFPISYFSFFFSISSLLDLGGR